MVWCTLVSLLLGCTAASHLNLILQNKLRSSLQRCSLYIYISLYYQATTWGKGGKWPAHESGIHHGVFVPSKNTINKIHIVQSLFLSIRQSRCRRGALADICQICADGSYCPAQCMEFTTQLKFRMGAAVGGSCSSGPLSPLNRTLNWAARRWVGLGWATCDHLEVWKQNLSLIIMISGSIVGSMQENASLA